MADRFADAHRLPPRAVLQMLAGAVMISFSAVFVRLADQPPDTSAFYRMFLGGSMLLAVVLWRRLPLWAGWRPFALACLVGFFFVLDLVFWHRSIHYVGPGLATILANFQVFALTAVGLTVYGERPSLRFWLGVPLAMLGLWLLVGVDWNQLTPQYHRGVWLGLATAAAYSAYMLTLRATQARADAPPAQSTMATSSLACAAMLAGVVGFYGGDFAIPDLQTAAAVTAYGLFGQVLGWVLLSTAMPQLNASVVGLMLLLQPSLSFVWDMWFFARPTTAVEIAGAVVALAGIYLGTTARARRG